MNRTEYRNSIRDLLGLDVDVASLLPPDDMGRGFDNMSDALTVTPALVQGYVRAASKISREAVGDPQVAPTMSMYSIPKVVNQMRHVEGTPLGTRGGIAVVQNFSADGDYNFRLKLYHDYIQALFGQNLPANIQGQQIEVSVDGERVAIFTIDPSIPETEAILTTRSGQDHSGSASDFGRVHCEIRRAHGGCIPASGTVDARCQRRSSRASSRYRTCKP